MPLEISSSFVFSPWLKILKITRAKLASFFLFFFFFFFVFFFFNRLHFEISSPEKKTITFSRTSENYVAYKLHTHPYPPPHTHTHKPQFCMHNISFSQARGNKQPSIWVPLMLVSTQKFWQIKSDATSKLRL